MHVSAIFLLPVLKKPAIFSDARADYGSDLLGLTSAFSLASQPRISTRPFSARQSPLLAPSTKQKAQYRLVPMGLAFQAAEMLQRICRHLRNRVTPPPTNCSAKSSDFHTTASICFFLHLPLHHRTIIPMAHGTLQLPTHPTGLYIFHSHVVQRARHLLVNFILLSLYIPVTVAAILSHSY